MPEVTVRLHATKDMDQEPVIMKLETPLPARLVLPGEFGLEVEYEIRHRYLPGAYDSTEASADYVLKGLA